MARTQGSRRLALPYLPTFVGLLRVLGGMVQAAVIQIVTFSSYASFRTRNYPMLSFGPPVQVRG